MKKIKRPQLFFLMVLLSLALIWGSSIPGLLYLGRILLLFSTLFHELGHALAAVMTGGHVSSLNIYWDASGLTTTYSSGGAFATAFIMAGGLVGPSLAASGLFWAARGKDKRLKNSILLLGISLVIIGVLVARSFWSLAFTVGLGCLLVAATKRLARAKLEGLTVFIAVQLGISVFTRSGYLFSQWAAPGQPSDVAQMSEALLLPYWVWGIICGALSLAVLHWGYRAYTTDKP